MPNPAVMSANEANACVFEAIKSGAEEYLVKPVTKKEVQNIWQYVWKRLSNARVSDWSAGRRPIRPSDWLAGAERTGSSASIPAIHFAF